MTDEVKDSTPAQISAVPPPSLPAPHISQSVAPVQSIDIRDEESRHRRYERRYWLASSLFSGIAMVGALTAAYAGYGAWTETRKAVDEAKRQNDIQERGSRPYVIAHNSYDRIVVDGSVPRSIGDARSFLGYVLYTNYGTTPAIIESIQGEIVIDPSREKKSDPELYTAGIITQAGRDVTSPFHYTRPVTGEEYAKLIRAEAFLYLRGEIKYRDVAGIPHSTKFCYEQRVEDTGSATNNIYHPVNIPDCKNEVK